MELTANQESNSMLSPVISIAPRDANILEGGVMNYHKRLFLESWHSTLDNHTVNKKKLLPHAYIPLI